MMDKLNGCKLIQDGDLLQKYNTIWDMVSTDMKKEFDSKPVYDKNYLKTKINSHGDEVTDFYNYKIPKLESNHTCLAVISLDSALKKNDNYTNILRKKQLGIFMIIWVMFLFLMSLMKNRLKLLSSWFLKMYFLKEQFWKSLKKNIF